MRGAHDNTYAGIIMWSTQEVCQNVNGTFFKDTAPYFRVDPPLGTGNF